MVSLDLWVILRLYDATKAMAIGRTFRVGECVDVKANKWQHKVSGLVVYTYWIPHGGEDSFFAVCANASI